MTKRLLDDIVKVKYTRKENKNIKNIQVERVVNVDYSKNKPRYMLWFVAFISAVFCFFAFSFLFSKAEVLVNPKTIDLLLNENFSASKESGVENLSFDLIVIDGTESKSIPVTGEKDVKEIASGTVLIYNIFSSSSQVLNIDTRLEGSNGKIYKTKNRVVVPGMMKDGKPGTVEVDIYGNEAGEEYNSPPLDFKIFGFKGNPKYSKFYARSKGIITGGFKGKVPDVSVDEKATALLALKNNLKSKLLKRSIDQIPSGFILFKDAIFLNTDDVGVLSDFNNEDNSAVFTLKGTLYGILFNEKNLTKKIIGRSIEKYNESDVYISNIRDLTFSLSNKDKISFSDLKNINFNLLGSMKIVWKLDIDKFSNDLLGKNKKDFNQVLLKYENIESAILKLNPIWRISIPSKNEDIKIIVNYPI